MGTQIPTTQMELQQMAMVLMHSSGTGVGCPPQEREYTQSAVDFLLSSSQQVPDSRKTTVVYILDCASSFVVCFLVNATSLALLFVCSSQLDSLFCGTLEAQSCQLESSILSA
jgi:hypothetical protein